MPRGRRKKVDEPMTVEQIKEAIATAETSLVELTIAVKDKKAKIKMLKKQLIAAETAEENAKQEKENNQLIAAFNESNKSIDEVLDFLK